MATYFKNKYRNESIRLQNWDYRWDGAYFITFCTKNRVDYFGEIQDGKMQLSQIGVIADICWNEIKNHSKNVTLGAFVVMPNHIHGVVILNNGYIKEDEQELSIIESTPKTIGQKRYQNIGKNSISSIIGSYKSAVTKHARRLGFEFEWQRLFYEHIIRDEKSFYHISNYIENNVKKWEEDRFMKENLT
ncbi:transposase [Crocinitomicaceae bacterium]|nr:transposase [Crocinitomicaceae bacterium]